MVNIAEIRQEFMEAHARVSGLVRSAHLMLDEIEEEYKQRLKDMEGRKDGNKKHNKTNEL